jgi:hypothetical protein
MVTLKISPCTNGTLTSDFDIGLDHPVHRGYGWGSSTLRRRSNFQTNWPTECRSQCNLKLHHCTANYRPALSSERAPYMKNKESNCHSNKCDIWSFARKWTGHQDELADWTMVVMWRRLRTYLLLYIWRKRGLLCGLVVRVSGYKSRGPELDSRRYQIFWEVVGLEQGLLRLLSAIEELIGRKSSGSGLENREYGCGIRHADRVAPSI